MSRKIISWQWTPLPIASAFGTNIFGNTIQWQNQFPILINFTIIYKKSSWQETKQTLKSRIICIIRLLKLNIREPQTTQAIIKAARHVHLSISSDASYKYERHTPQKTKYNQEAISLNIFRGDQCYCSILAVSSNSSMTSTLPMSVEISFSLSNKKTQKI